MAGGREVQLTYCPKLGRNIDSKYCFFTKRFLLKSSSEQLRVSWVFTRLIIFLPQAIVSAVMEVFTLGPSQRLCPSGCSPLSHSGVRHAFGQHWPHQKPGLTVCWTLVLSRSETLYRLSHYMSLEKPIFASIKNHQTTFELPIRNSPFVILINA